jgi:hypothetical protein
LAALPFRKSTLAASPVLPRNLPRFPRDHCSKLLKTSVLTSVLTTHVNLFQS